MQHGWRKVGLWAAAPDQHSALPLQPLLLGKAGGDGVDFGGFADDQQETGLAAPEIAIVQAQIVDHLYRDFLLGCLKLRQGRERLRAAHQFADAALQNLPG
ncbi:hypothetical protein D3C81_1728870 [compost metagenome]